MGFLQRGVWHGGDHDQIGAQGWEPRREQFKGYVRAQPDAARGDLPAEAGRYQLIVCPGCPLSHRARIVHSLKQLADVVSLSCVRPVMGPNGREFGTARAAAPDPITGAAFLHDLYRETDPDHSGRDSTPVLWDRKTRRIVSNTYRDILTMLNSEFNGLTPSRINVQPSDLRGEIDAELSRLGSGLLGVVYRAGFSRDQSDYERHAAVLGETIRSLAERLQHRPFLLGETLTEPDVALIVCLVRYDAIYLPLFRCTAERIEDHPALTNYIRRILSIPGVSETFDLSETMTHYYVSHAHINPTRIVPLSPRLSWWPS